MECFVLKFLCLQFRVLYYIKLPFECHPWVLQYAKNPYLVVDDVVMWLVKV